MIGSDRTDPYWWLHRSLFLKSLKRPRISTFLQVPFHRWSRRSGPHGPGSFWTRCRAGMSILTGPLASLPPLPRHRGFGFSGLPTPKSRPRRSGGLILFKERLFPYLSSKFEMINLGFWFLNTDERLFCLIVILSSGSSGVFSSLEDFCLRVLRFSFSSLLGFRWFFRALHSLVRISDIMLVSRNELRVWAFTPSLFKKTKQCGRF